MLENTQQPKNSNPQSQSDNTDLDSKLDEIFKQFYDLGADSVLIDWERQDYKKLKKTAHTQIKHLITQARINTLHQLKIDYMHHTLTQHPRDWKPIANYIEDRIAELKAKGEL